MTLTLSLACSFSFANGQKKLTNRVFQPMLQPGRPWECDPIFFLPNIACVAGGILVRGVFFWRRSRHPKRTEKPRGKISNWLVRTLFAAPSPKQHSHANLDSYAGYSQHKYPKLLRILWTLPVTSAECKRSFSTLKRLKTYLRSTMNTERQSGLAVMNIH